MEPLTVVCVGAGLVVGALLAWAIRGRQLSRQQQTHRQEYEAEAANHRVKIETLEVDREAVHGELGRSQQAMGETRAARSREQAAAGQQITAAEARIGELSAELGQFREQLEEAQREIERHRRTGRDLSDQLAAARQQSQELTEQLQETQQQLSAVRRERDQLVAEFDSGDGTSTDPQQRKRWRINTFFGD